MTKLETIRKAKKIKRIDLSRATNISTATLRAYENGTLRVDGAELLKLCKIAKVLNCRVVDILEEQETINAVVGCF